MIVHGKHTMAVSLDVPRGDVWRQLREEMLISAGVNPAWRLDDEDTAFTVERTALTNHQLNAPGMHLFDYRRERVKAADATREQAALYNAIRALEVAVNRTDPRFFE